MIEMTKNIKYSLSLLIALTTLMSCLNNDDDNIAELTNDTALISFSIQAIKAWKHTTSSTGSDSVFSIMQNAPACKFDIDHLNGLVFNRDSLPKNYDVSKVLCIASAFKNGIVAYHNALYDTLSVFSTVDTLDFTNPIEFRVYPSDGSQIYRAYSVSLNVHKESGDSVKWQFMANVPELACNKLKAFSLENKVYAFCSNGVTTNIFGSGNGLDWSKLDSSINLNSDAYNNTVTYNGEFYTLTDGCIYRSVDAINWNYVSSVTLDKLIAAGTLEMYGMKNGWIMYSNDGGLTWQRDNIDVEDSTYLPSQDFSYSLKSVASNSQTEKVILIGNRSLTEYPNDKQAMVWQKTIEKRVNSRAYNWMRSVYSPSVECQLKRVGNASVILYDNHLLAYQPDGFYKSNDEGLVWNKNNVYATPSEFTEVSDSLVITVDADNCIWIIGNTGHVWRARLNRLAWQSQNTIFDEK